MSLMPSEIRSKGGAAELGTAAHRVPMLAGRRLMG